MYQKMIDDCRAAVGAATKRVELAEKALSDARAIRVSAASMAARFRDYSHQRTEAFAEYMDTALLQSAGRLDNGVPDLMMDRGGADSDALHFLLQDVIAGAIEARCRKLFPATGPTVAEKLGKIAKAEQELAAARDAYSDCVSALQRLQQDPPAAQLAGGGRLLNGA